MDSVFKQTLRSEMEFKDIKVKELAVRTGISQRTLEGYLGARASIPPADVAVKIAGVLGVSVEYLVTGATSQPVQPIDPPPAAGKDALLAEFETLLKHYDVRKRG